MNRTDSSYEQGHTRKWVTSPDSLESKLDILVPSFNRPAKLHRLLSTGTSLLLPQCRFVVIDDGSTYSEEITSFGKQTTEGVCSLFGPQVLCLRNETNIGLAASLTDYYRKHCRAKYTMLVNDKDEFISGQPILSALQKLDCDKSISIVMIPLRQIDRVETDRPLLFNYSRMPGSEFIARYVRDTMLQHCGMYGIIRVSVINEAGVPRSLNLRKYGLEDAFGIDIDFLLNCAVTGDVEFESVPHVRRSIIGGLTERYPLSFAYCYYQYAKRIMSELRSRNLISRKTSTTYLSWWHLLILRGFVASYRHDHKSEQEYGTTRIRRHLSMPLLLYIPVECVRFRILLRTEAVNCYIEAARWVFSDSKLSLQRMVDDFYKALRSLSRNCRFPSGLGSSVVLAMKHSSILLFGERYTSASISILRIILRHLRRWL